MGRTPRGGITRRKDGRWQVSVQVGGTRRSWYARSETEARALLDRLRRALLLGHYQPPTRLTLGEWLAQDGAYREQAGLRPSTLATERQVLGRLPTALLGRRLHQLTPPLVAAALVELRRQGMGARRLELLYAALRASLARAVRMGVLVQNPVEQVPRPRYAPGERASWTLAQVRDVLAVAMAEPWPCRYAPLVVFLLASGMRFSEAIALRWGDVNAGAGAGTVRVARALVEVRGKVYEGAPKSTAGRRVVTLPVWGRVVLERLWADHVRRHGRPPGPDERIFTARNGAPPRQCVVGEQLARLCARAAVPRVRVHDLRAIHISLLTGAGFDPKVVQARAGHRRLDLTLNVYARPTTTDWKAAELLDQLLASGQIRPPVLTEHLADGG